MLVYRIVMLLERLEAPGEVGTQLWRVVVAERGVVQAELVLVIVGEVRDFLAAVSN